MLGLTQTATLYKRIGRQNGVTTYSATGTAFACRIEESSQRNAKNGTFRRNDEIRRGNEWQIYALAALNAEAGDRIEYGTTHYIVQSVRRFRCVHGAHHVEMLCAGEG